VATKEKRVKRPNKNSRIPLAGAPRGATTKRQVLEEPASRSSSYVHCACGSRL